MIKTFNPDYKNTLLQKMERPSFMTFIGFSITNIAEGSIEGELVLEEKHKQHLGFVHGGLTATLADIVAGYAAITLIPPDCHVVTADLKISYLNPGLGHKLLARGWVLKQGRKLNFCEAEIFTIKGEEPPVLIAKASATMAVIHPEDIH